MNKQLEIAMVEFAESFIEAEEDQDPKITPDAVKRIKKIKLPELTEDLLKEPIDSKLWDKIIRQFSELTSTYPEIRFKLKGKTTRVAFKNVHGFCPSYKKGGGGTQNKIAEKLNVGVQKHFGTFLEYNKNEAINYRPIKGGGVIIIKNATQLIEKHRDTPPEKFEEQDHSMDCELVTENAFKKEIADTIKAVEEVRDYVLDQTKPTASMKRIIKELAESSIFIFEEEI